MLPTKVDLRQAALARRDALTPAERRTIAAAIAARPFPLSAAARIVAGYCAIRSEIDALPLMRALARQGARLALPLVVARDAPLQFRNWSEDAPLMRGAFGIAEPLADAELVVPDIVLVPLAAFDRAGHRIGYGAGYYDRTLAQLGQAKPVIAVGIAASVQQVDRVPALPHDARLAYIMTEHDSIETRGS